MRIEATIPGLISLDIQPPEALRALRREYLGRLGLDTDDDDSLAIGPDGRWMGVREEHGSMYRRTLREASPEEKKAMEAFGILGGLSL